MSEQNPQQPSNEAIRKEIRTRYTILVVLFFIPVLVILYHVVVIQLVEGRAWNKLAFADRQENLELEPNRGNILSCDGQLMASTVPSYQLLMDFKSVEKDTFLNYLNPLCQKLSAKLKDRSALEYRKHLMNGYLKRNSAWLVSKTKVNYLDLMEIKKFPLYSKGQYKSGLYTRKFLQRKKPFGSLASRTIGDIYGEISKGGKNGLELQYDSILRGTSGTCVRRKIAGKYIRVSEVNPVDGIDLMTTIDVHMQDIAETALRRELNRVHATSGTVVLMDVATGQVKAISNLGQTTTGEYAETKNFAVSDQSEPGSTFKTFSMMVGLEDGVIHPDDPVDTKNGVVPMYNRFMRDHNAHRGGYGLIDAKKSIWNSSNIGISTLIEKHYKHDPMKFINGLRKIGLNQSLNLEIPGSGRPRIPDPNSKGWSKLSMPWMSIGYVATVPPIYTLAYYNAIANGGKLMRPYFVKGFYQNGELLRAFEPQVVKEKISSDKTLNAIRDMLDSVVTAGTGAYVHSDIVSISGKTGTAQLAKGAQGYKGAGGTSHQVSFCGFFPSDAPRFSAIVVIREPKGELPSGGHQAGGVFKEIAERIYIRELRLRPGEIPKTKKVRVDTLPHADQPRYPIVKTGRVLTLRTAMASLNIPYAPEGTNNDWIRLESSNHGFRSERILPETQVVPGVIGMGARDACTLLGSLGLDVRIRGRGKVTGQSLPRGSTLVRGKCITLTLE